MDRTYSVSGMTCQHCVNAVSAELSAVEGVSQVSVDLANGTVRVSGERFTDEQVRTAVDEAGYALVD